ncbi:MAG TPA: protein kinase, partial [Planctomycetaceae bacterium]|nr:protein kinase [Planctomycetaceae bacterium]
MNGNLQTDTCDTDRLESYLNGELSEVQELEFTAHLDQCEPCRRSLELRAADPESWSEAEQLLKPFTLDAEQLAPPRSQAPQIQQVLDALAPTDDPAMLGRLGGYEVSGVVGAGGMGVVLKAVDKSLDRTVAIKVLAPHLATSGAARKRFAREAKAAAAVLHPNVIAIHSVSNDEMLPYLVMPYVRGASLQKRLDAEGPLALPEILRIGSQIAAGLSAAHAQGLVHRDIKPANILLEDGIERVAITDFGLARAVDDATITRSGVIAGTPQYMSPEQARGESIDQRSDLFSLGSVLYAICTGRPPFRAETTFGVMRRISDDEATSIREINSDIPDWLCTIVSRLMSKRASDRFESAEAVQELLEQCLAHVQQPDSVPLPEFLVPQPTRGRSFFHSPRKGLFAMLGTLGFILLGMFLWQSSEPPDIAGQWSGEWGQVVLKETSDAEYAGYYSDTIGNQPGEIQLKWSRAERRFNGTWQEGADLNGKLSLRLVGDEIRGALTSSKKSAKESGTPRLADFVWKRAVEKQPSESRPRRTESGDAPERHRRIGEIVTDVEDQKLVEISIGADDGLRVRDTLLDVSRDKKYLGKITVVRVLADKSVARIESRTGEIRRGDRVTKESATNLQIKITSPQNMEVVVADQRGDFGRLSYKVPARLNLIAGKTHRLKLTNIAGREGAEFYPTFGIGSTASQTATFLAHNAIPIEFTEEDFDQALAGSLVTKVIYLPDPEFREVGGGEVETVVSTRLDPGADPIAEAGRRGSILAVIRLGNKVIELPSDDAAEVDSAAAVNDASALPKGLK